MFNRSQLLCYEERFNILRTDDYWLCSDLLPVKENLKGIQERAHTGMKYKDSLNGFLTWSFTHRECCGCVIKPPENAENVSRCPQQIENKQGDNWKIIVRLEQLSELQKWNSWWVSMWLYHDKLHQVGSHHRNPSNITPWAPRSWVTDKLHVNKHGCFDGRRCLFLVILATRTTTYAFLWCGCCCCCAYIKVPTELKHRIESTLNTSEVGTQRA